MGVNPGNQEAVPNPPGSAETVGTAGLKNLNSLHSPSQELEAALHRDDVEFISDLIACLLQGCYQRRDIT